MADTPAPVDKRRCGESIGRKPQATLISQSRPDAPVEEDAPELPEPTLEDVGMSVPDISIALALLTGNPVGVNGVHADQQSRDHQGVGRRIKRRSVVSFFERCQVETNI
ncbi:MAG: hypothetical protein WBW35_20190 [Xanthobacteraceae bacterium]